MSDESVYPELYFLVYPASCSQGYSTNPKRWPKRSRAGAIGILHLHRDGTTTMEQP